MIGVRGTYWGIYAHLASEESVLVVCQARITGSSTIKEGVVRVNIRSAHKGTCNGTRSGSPGGRARGRNCHPSARDARRYQWVTVQNLQGSAAEVKYLQMLVQQFPNFES